MKKILCLTVVLLTLLSCFTSCDNSEQTSPLQKRDFKIGEKLTCLIQTPCELPLMISHNYYMSDDTATIENIKIENLLKCDINNFDTFIDGTFYAYRYKITFSGRVDEKYANKYLKIVLHTDGELYERVEFDGNIEISGLYNSETNKTILHGCWVKTGDDGTFTTEIIGYGNDILSEYMPISVNIH